jgi:hypothetical protein
MKATARQAVGAPLKGLKALVRNDIAGFHAEDYRQELI